MTPSTVSNFYHNLIHARGNLEYINLYHKKKGVIIDMPRTITGLDVQEDFSCEVLDLAQKIAIMRETPSSKKISAYTPDNDTIVYQTIDAADDIGINSLSSLTTPDNASD
jgi:hypothetical protein